jgi:geranylgeranyl reductase family protein
VTERAIRFGTVPEQRCDVVVIGGGPAGLTAARVAATAGADVVVLERARHPRYKTCGGGLIGTSLTALPVAAPVRDRIDRVEITLRGRRCLTRTADGVGLLSMVNRSELDAALCEAAEAAGAQVRQNAAVRALEQDDGAVRVRLADGSTVLARTGIGADGSSGVTARHVGVVFDQVDLGLEVELPVDGVRQERWRHTVRLDWGPIPGSYAWVFPKDDVLTVGVIAERGRGELTRSYLADFVASLGLDGVTPEQDSGHLTRCRAPESPLRRDRVVVVGDAAGLLEPWTREGISFALRSGALAGAAAAADDLDRYPTAVLSTLEPEMAAGRRILRAFSRRPAAFHAVIATPAGWAYFARFCRGETSFDRALRHASIRRALSLLA